MIAQREPQHTGPVLWELEAPRHRCPVCGKNESKWSWKGDTGCSECAPEGDKNGLEKQNM